MFLTSELVRWAIETLRVNCHPFVGVTFLAAKSFGMPVGTLADVRLDAITKNHLERYHRLDSKSEFFFQPFKSQRSNFWVAGNYSSSGLQAINTQTFGEVWLHPRKAPRWAFAEDYVEVIGERLQELGGYGRVSLVALAVWIGKGNEWGADADISTVIAEFRKTFRISDEEVAGFFDPSTKPEPGIEVTGGQATDLRRIAHDFALPPDAPEETQGALRSVRLVDVGPARDLCMEFGDRLTLVAGDNGLGKSFLLDVGWWALTGTWAGHAAYPVGRPTHVRPRIEFRIQNLSGKELVGSSDFDWRTHTWHHTTRPPSVAALAIYARVDGSFAVMDETRGQVKVGDAQVLTRFTTSEVWEGKAAEIEGLVRDWVSWQLSADTGPFSMLSRVLEHLSPEDMGPLVPSDPIRIPGDPRRIPTIRHVYGDVPVLFASAGVQRVLQLAYLIIWSWQEHLLAAEQTGSLPFRKMVIVVDEIEAHLHPKWQRLILPALMSVGKLLSDQLEVQVIAATHSPMVLASVESEFAEESDSMLHFSLTDGVVRLEKLDFYKYGDVSSWLTSSVFGLAHARSRAAEDVIQQAKNLQLEDAPSTATIEEVTQRLKQTLAPDDTFWSRWIYFARRHGGDI